MAKETIKTTKKATKEKPLEVASFANNAYKEAQKRKWHKRETIKMYLGFAFFFGLMMLGFIIEAL